MKERCKVFFSEDWCSNKAQKEDEIYIKPESASFEKWKHLQTINFDGLPS